MLKVVALGIVNAGKSSLLSALIDRQNAFPSGDVPRVTRHIQTEHCAEFAFVDTPGLDATVEDAERAYEDVQSSDQVLWCHSLRMGELRPTEISALKRYRGRSRNRLWRTCFVLTHGDNVAGFEVIRTVSIRIAEQLGEIFNMEFIGVDECAPLERPGRGRPRPFYVVGTDTYWRARLSNDLKSEFLLKRSGVPRLRNFLMSLNQKRQQEAIL